MRLRITFASRCSKICGQKIARTAPITVKIMPTERNASKGLHTFRFILQLSSLVKIRNFCFHSTVQLEENLQRENEAIYLRKRS